MKEMYFVGFFSVLSFGIRRHLPGEICTSYVHAIILIAPWWHILLSIFSFFPPKASSHLIIVHISCRVFLNCLMHLVTITLYTYNDIDRCLVLFHKKRLLLRNWKKNLLSWILELPADWNSYRKVPDILSNVFISQG